jgi:hypothetical protein
MALNYYQSTDAQGNVEFVYAVDTVTQIVYIQMSDGSLRWSSQGNTAPITALTPVSDATILAAEVSYTGPVLDIQPTAVNDPGVVETQDAASTN